MSRSARGVDTAREPINNELLQKYFPEMPAAVRAVFAALSDEKLATLVNELTRTHAKQKAGTSLSSFVERSFLRQVQPLLAAAFGYASEHRCYHQTTAAATGNLLTSTCQLHTATPVLHFVVERTEENGLLLLVKLTINGDVYALNELKREKLVLQLDHQYYLLRYEDYQLLQWLEANDPAVYSHDPSGFSAQVLARLTDYRIDTAQMEAVEMIETDPQPAVYLSEISHSFLLLTPRWNYDGFWVEGNWQHSERFHQQGKTYEVRRNKIAEENFRQQLQALHPNFGRQLNGVYHLSFTEAGKKHWFLKVYHQLLADNIEVLGMAFLKHFRYAAHPLETSVVVQELHNGWQDLLVELRCGKEKIALHEMQKLLLSGQKSLLLKDQSILLLTDEWLQANSLLLKHGRVKGDVLSVPQWLFLTLQQTDSTVTRVVNEEWRARWQHWQESDQPLYPVSPLVTANLRTYQQKGYEWLCLLQEIDAGACLADDMGLGKTLQTICFLAKQLGLQENKKALVVCPASLLHNWKAELQRFAPALSAFVYHDAGRELGRFFDDPTAAILITSYGTLRSDIDLLSVIEWEVVVLDESHTIKNPSAQITRAVWQLRARSRIALSGTPVMNNTMDLFAQLHYLVPGLLGQMEFFRREYAMPIDRYLDAEKMTTLQQITAPFILRRTKQQVATDLPPKTESVLWCEMAADQKNLYEETLSQVRDSIFLNIKQAGLAKSKLSILQGMQRLRQICAAPSLLEGQPGVSSVKAGLLIDHLRGKLRKNKVLVFSQFKGMLHLLASACQKAGIDYYHFDGDTAPAKRMEMVTAFQEPGNGVNVFLISLKAGNTGLTLTAADYVFLVDPWWNTAVQQQAIDRAYRIGQTKKVFAYQMICKDSIEEKIIELQLRKKSLSDALVSEEDGFIKNLSEEELMYLFS
ncbi:MAG TPA: DEAD/DEAH box helicase [Flavihumibacter sp.]|nr:DEAD/DEAH box helicase [Flavihumibacter sp.]HQD08221.1 DEAD/DEAH box helicase [Flavihumibacter sp.]